MDEQKEQPEKINIEDNIDSETEEYTVGGLVSRISDSEKDDSTKNDDPSEEEEAPFVPKIHDRPSDDPSPEEIEKQNAIINEEKEKRKAKKDRISRITTAALFLVLIVGLCIMLYPSFSDWWNSFHATQAIASYVQAVDSMDTAEMEEKLDAARAYNEKLSLGVDFELSDEEYAAYEEILDISGTGIMGYISIPSIDVNLPIYHGTDEAVLQIAAGHLAGSSLPVGGESTHAVISGHRGLPSAKLFTDLDELVVGDTFTITVLNETVTYRVDQILVVTPDDVSALSIERGKDYCTLVTCTPYGINSHRMLVRGHRVENDKEDLVVIINSDASKIPSYFVAIVVALPLLIAAVIVYLVFSSIKRRPPSATEVMTSLKEKDIFIKK